MVNAKLTQPEGDRTKHYLAARLGSLYVVTFNVLTDTYACERLECVSAYVRSAWSHDSSYDADE